MGWGAMGRLALCSSIATNYIDCVRSCNKTFIASWVLKLPYNQDIGCSMSFSCSPRSFLSQQGHSSPQELVDSKMPINKFESTSKDINS
jgi:hypothetical protein